MATKQGYSIVKEGYLLKESLHFKQFRKRWIVLNIGYIDCYKDNASHDVTETFNLSKFRDVRISIEGKPGQFELIPKRPPPGSGKVRKQNRCFIASSTKSMNEWIKQIKHCMGRTTNNFKSIHKDGHNKKNINKKPPSKKPLKIKQTKKPSYTESDIKDVTIWYSNELQIVREQNTKQQNELMAQIEELQTALNEIKHKHSKRVEV